MAATIATAVEQIVASSVGSKMDPALSEPSAARVAITPVGSRVTAEVLMARKSAIELVATPFTGLSFSSSTIAFRPKGVAAFPRPSMLEAMFRIMQRDRR